MNDLVALKGNDVFTDSLIIAEGTNNKHQNVKEMIKKYEKDLKDFGTLHVLNVESTGGRPEQYYQLNEEQATFLMTLFRNNKIVVKFKKELVRQFYEMRKFIIERHSNEWIETRQQSKSTRMAESDIIKKFIEYAKQQGSGHADNYYKLYSTLANKTVGINKRDETTIAQLNNLTLIENIILHTIDDGINIGLAYKKIFENCKKKLEIFKSLLYLEHSA